jgi:very-short-patch-repair endonuclease
MLVAGTSDERIAGIASRQRGRVSRRQLLAAGLSASQISGRVARGQLRARRRGVYAVGHEAPIALTLETEALLAVAPGAALSHMTAAGLWGMLAPAFTASTASPASCISTTIHLTVRIDSRLPGINVHRRRGLTARDLRIRHGLTVTSPAWTLLDVAGTLQTRALERAFDHLLTERLMRPSQLRELLGRVPTIAGRRRVVRLLDREQGPRVTRSEAEERLLAVLRAGDLPEPEVNGRRHGWEIDFFWPEARLAVEIDGYQFHSTNVRFTRDRRKDAQLAAHGITVIRFTWDQLVDAPLAVVARISGLLAQRS